MYCIIYHTTSMYSEMYHVCTCTWTNLYHITSMYNQMYYVCTCTWMNRKPTCTVRCTMYVHVHGQVQPVCTMRCIMYVHVHGRIVNQHVLYRTTSMYNEMYQVCQNIKTGFIQPVVSITGNYQTIIKCLL